MAKKESKTKKTGRRQSIQKESETKIPVVSEPVESPKAIWESLKQENTTPEEIRHAIRTLPLIQVLPLLQELLAQFDAQQARDAVLTEWIKTVLLTHTAYFMNLPEVVQQLSNLYQALDDRLTVYPKLLAMHGRLDLIQSQIDSRHRKETDESDHDSEGGHAYSDSEDEDDIEDDEDEVDEDDEDELMDNNDENEMFKEEEVSYSEDDDVNLSDSDLEA